MLRGSMLGVDISERSIKVVRLSNDRRHRLLARQWCEIPEGVIQHGIINNTKIVGQALLDTVAKCGIKHPSQEVLVASIPESESFLRVVEIPDMEDEEVGEAIQWEVAQHMPFGLENVYLDWQWVKTEAKIEAGRREVLVGAAEKKVVDPLFAALVQLGFDVAALELESQAIVRALISEELRDKQGLLIVDLGATVTNVVVHNQGAIRFSATLKRGVQGALATLTAEERAMLMGPAKSIDSSLAMSISEKLQAPLDEVVAEIHGIMEYYTTDKNRHINEILLTGGGANLVGLDRAFHRYFDNIHLSRGNPSINILPHQGSVSPLMNASESVHYSTALGLALRQIDF